MFKNNYTITTTIIYISILLTLPFTAAQEQPQLFFREDWKEIPAALPVTQDHVSSENLILHLHGPGKNGIKKSHHDNIVNDPYYIWSGQCSNKWALSLYHKTAYVNLCDSARIRWRTRQSGNHFLRIIIKLSNGDWFISDQSDGPSPDWYEQEFLIDDIQWYEFDINTISKVLQVSTPDLKAVEEIGFTDLIKGNGSSSCSRLDWVEVWGDSVSKDTVNSGMQDIKIGKKFVFSLKQNFPNPSNPGTTINYEIPKDGYVDLKIYDLLGHKIKTLISSNQSKGIKSVYWDGCNDTGKEVPPGIYLYRLCTGSYSETKKICIIQ